MKLCLRFLFLMCLLTPSLTMAVQPDEMLTDPVLEARARTISAGLRCMVCQNQSIDDSDADLAHDLRLLVRQRLQAGDGDEAVRRYLVERYGDYILLNPPLKNSTLILWMGPPVVGMFAIVFVGLMLRRRKNDEEMTRPLSMAEGERLKELFSVENVDQQGPLP